MWEQRSDNFLLDAMVRESCLIHMRLLLDFFYPRRNFSSGKFKDVFASDYLPDSSQWSKRLQELLAVPSWLQDYRDQLDWRLAHLTTERLSFKKERLPWEPQKQFVHLETLISEFIAAVPDETRARFNPLKQ